MQNLFASPANNIPNIKLSNLTEQNITEQVSYFSLKNNSLTLPTDKSTLISLISSQQAHTKTNVFGDKYVVVFELHNDTQQTEWFIYPYGSVVQNIEIFCYACNNFSEPTKTGHGANNQQDFHYGSKIEINPGQHKTIAMIFDSPYFFSPIKILVKPFEQAEKLFHLENILLLIGLGICLALGIYNIFIFTSTRDYQYLTYALSTLSYGFGWAAVFGIPEYLDFKNSQIWLMPAYLSGAFFSCIFNIQFLRLNKFYPKMALTLKMVAVGCFLSLPFAFYSSGLGLYLASIFTSISAIIGIYTGIRSWIEGYTPAKYYTLALLSVVLPNMVGNLMNLGVLPGFNVNIYLLGLLGNCLDSLLLAFALAAQVRLLSIKNNELNNSLEQTVNQRTQELMQANHQLELTNADLVEANETKGRFLATMSHEIRTPLTSIIGYADGILLGDIDKSEQDRVTKIIAQNGSHLLSVLNDILDLSKIEANKLDFESIPTPLFSVLAQIESIIGKRTKDKGLAFHLEYQYPLPAKIYTDPTRLKQILFNLTNNALKFTEQGFIGLSVSIKNDQLQIKVKDSGAGISPQHKKELFEPFNQADNSINRRNGGTGLGLSISQRLAKGLNGDIFVDSTPRKGSTFTFSMKLDAVENTNWINSVSEIWQSTPAKSVKPDILPNFSGNKVLLADDHPANRELITLLLKRMNIDVVQVEDGKQALDTIFYQKFDLIMLDIHMPKMDGTDALKQIRLAGNNTPVVALTANNMKHEVEHYMRLGFSDHLAKPISRHHFIETLTKYLSKQGDVENPINKSDMLKLIEDYRLDLVTQIDKVTKAFEQRDMFLISEISHRIKGSAGAFGFALIGEKFADIEHSALQDDEIAVSYELPKILNLSRLFIDLPGVDISKGITNHHNSAEQFIRKLYELAECSELILKDLKAALKNHEVNSALVHLYKLLPIINECELEQSIQSLNALEELIKKGEWDKEQYLNLIDQIEQSIKLLSNKLLPDLLNELEN